MSELPRIVNSVMDVADSESRPVLGPAGNKTRSVAELRKPKSKVGKPELVKKFSSITPPAGSVKDCKVLKKNLSMNASCSSDASSDSSHSRASTGKISRRSVTPKRSAGLKTGKVDSGLKTVSKIGKVESVSRGEKVENVGLETDSLFEASLGRKRCAWVTANTGII